jgi:PilZ domain
MDPGHGSRRAQRFGVSWPARVRRLNSEDQWHTCRTVNLSVTGTLLRTYRRYKVGERLEVQIEFITQPEPRTVIVTLAEVVRQEVSIPGGAAVHFLIPQPDATDALSA